MDAERAWRDYARRHGASLSILRAPGIYAAERLPLERLRAGTPLALASEDGYSNHIHADDLAGLACAALRRRAAASACITPATMKRWPPAPGLTPWPSTLFCRARACRVHNCASKCRPRCGRFARIAPH